MGAEVEDQRECPFHGCGSPVRDGMFACQNHWFQLDPWERREIAMAISEWRAGLIDVGELRRRQQEVLRKRGTVPVT
jgi:hypothetical protein